MNIWVDNKIKLLALRFLMFCYECLNDRAGEICRVFYGVMAWDALGGLW